MRQHPNAVPEREARAVAQGGRQVPGRLVDLLRWDGNEDLVPSLEPQLAETVKKIDRLVAALAAGPDDLPSVRATLSGFERESVRLEEEKR